ncbi:exopolysaccharide biosynthesis protein [Pseudoroseomonas rhizosphaerae]|uniref:Exopolysaccharide biosynthesis protein n=2 Tax=Teichococcus rhizosphaerae TaxID=1335062 RepID=A0A2C7AEH1_9PROT|nr:exopolysaccharide biosynthesis protein [Pseudoroseomonas rhizosphaerae]
MPRSAFSMKGVRAGLRGLAMGAALLLAACANPGADLPPLPQTVAGPYKLGPGDQLRVTVFNDPRLTGEFRVTDSGTIALPLVGAIPVSGRTTAEAETAIVRSLRSRNLFNDPSVAVEIQEYRPVFVLGMVERGGQTPYQPGMTALAAVAVSGGFNYRAVTEYVGLTRIGEDGQPREYRTERQTLLQPGDVVTVFERRF